MLSFCNSESDGERRLVGVVAASKSVAKSCKLAAAGGSGAARHLASAMRSLGELEALAEEADDALIAGMRKAGADIGRGVPPSGPLGIVAALGFHRGAAFHALAAADSAVAEAAAAIEERGEK